MTIIVPLEPGRDYAEIVAQAPAGSTTFINGWLALSQHPNYGFRGDDDAFTRDLPGGQMRARIDLRHLVDTYRDLIDAGLDQLEMQFDRMAEDPDLGGFDFAAVMELYLDGIRLFLDGVDVIDIGAEVAGTEIRIETGLDVLPESPLAVATAGEPTALPEIAHTVDPSAALVMYMALDWDRAMTWLGPAIDSVIAFYPDEFGQFMQAQMDHYAELYPLLGNCMAASGGFGSGGMRFAYAFDATDAQGYIDGYVELMQTALPDVEGMEFDGPHDREIGGVGVVEVTTIFGEEFYGLMLGQDVEGLSPQELEALRPSMEAMYGEDGLVLRLATSGQRLAMVMGR